MRGPLGLWYVIKRMKMKEIRDWKLGISLNGSLFENIISFCTRGRMLWKKTYIPPMFC
jgi:hypothetical protein